MLLPILRYFVQAYIVGLISVSGEKNFGQQTACFIIYLFYIVIVHEVQKI